MNEKITDLKSLRINKINKILIIDKKHFNSSDVILDKTAQMLDKGFNLVEFFPDYTNDDSNLNLAQKLRQLTSIYESMFLIKNRIDMAQIADADGIICDCSSIKPFYIRKILKKDKIIAFDAIYLFRDEIENIIKEEYDNIDFIQGKSEFKINGIKFFASDKIEGLK